MQINDDATSFPEEVKGRRPGAKRKYGDDPDWKDYKDGDYGALARHIAFTQL